MAADGFTLAPSRVPTAYKRPRAADECLLASPDRGGMTAAMRRVLDTVARLARTGSPMLNNPQLGEGVGGISRSSALRALGKLSAAGLIEIELRIDCGKRVRRVRIVATNLCTGWGEARLGHSPYIHRRRGEPPPAARPAKVRTPLSRPLKPHAAASPTLFASVADLQPHSVLPAMARKPPGRTVKTRLTPVHQLQLPFEPVTTAVCRYPKWRDGERPGRSPRYCDKPTSGAASFCREHVGLCLQTKPSRGRRAK